MANKIGFILWVIRCFWKIGLIGSCAPLWGNHGKDVNQQLTKRYAEAIRRYKF
jgi:hypothetical protein